MQFTFAAVAAVMATAVAAGGNGTAVWVTDIVNVYTTVCPAATTFAFNGVTYTATASQTITITNCPCTVSKPVYTTPVVSVTPVYVNTTVVPTKTPVVVVGTGSPATSSKGPAFTGAANKAVAGSAAGLAGLLGLAAYIL